MSTVRVYHESFKSKAGDPRDVKRRHWILQTAVDRWEDAVRVGRALCRLNRVHSKVTSQRDGTIFLKGR